MEDQRPYKMARYKECLKNHAAVIGGNATDGCGEFMPAGEEGTLEAFKCSACDCHRNFHRKLEIEPECFLLPRKDPYSSHHLIYKSISPNKSVSNPSESDEKEDDRDKNDNKEVRKPEETTVRKRFRTKFTQEQKEKMISFAEKAGWKIQKLEDSVVQQFCQEIGIRRRVLKVWMHNNKRTFGKKNPSIG